MSKKIRRAKSKNQPLSDEHYGISFQESTLEHAFTASGRGPVQLLELMAFRAKHGLSRDDSFSQDLAEAHNMMLESNGKLSFERASGICQPESKQNAWNELHTIRLKDKCCRLMHRFILVAPCKFTQVQVARIIHNYKKPSGFTAASLGRYYSQWTTDHPPETSHNLLEWRFTNDARIIGGSVEGKIEFLRLFLTDDLERQDRKFLQQQIAALS